MFFPKLLGLIVSVLLATVTIENVDSADILAVFPTPSISHQIVFRPLTQELARRGHNLVIITTDPAFPNGGAPGNITEIDIHDISYKLWHEFFVKKMSGDTSDAVDSMLGFVEGYIEITEHQYKLKAVQDFLKKKPRFDLLIIEACARQSMAFAGLFDAPVILISSFGSVSTNMQVIGAPAHPILYPEIVRTRLYNLNFWEKIRVSYDDYRVRFRLWMMEDKMDSSNKRIFGQDIAPITELENKVDLLLLNVHPLWQDNRPVPPSVILVPGLHKNPTKELPKDIKEYLDNSPQGVIYMSFGTNVQPSLLPEQRIKIFKDVFAKLPYKVLWRWDKDTMADKPANVDLFKWMPQSDVLKHKNVKAFITQGGLQSTDEAIEAAVPLIVFPMGGDQWVQAEKYVKHGIGIQLSVQTFTEEDLTKAIDAVINDKSYSKNIQGLRKVMRDQPESSLERAVWWTEHVIRHGGASHLRSPAANISWWDFLVLDVVLTLLAAFTFAVIVIVWVLKKLLTPASKGKKVKRS